MWTTILEPRTICNNTLQNNSIQHVSKCACITVIQHTQLTYIIGPSTGHNTALRAVCRYWPAEG